LLIAAGFNSDPLRLGEGMRSVESSFLFDKVTHLTAGRILALTWTLSQSNLPLPQAPKRNGTRRMRGWRITSALTACTIESGALN
jgi:hypothetical protein